LSGWIVRVGTVLACSLAGLAVCAPAASATSQTFTNSAAMTIPIGGNASTYPSTIDVSGLAGSITDVNVEVKGISHTDISEVGMVLVAPGGQSLGFIDGIGIFSGGGVSDLDFLIDDQAAATFQNSSVPSASGSFKPRFFQIENFPAPGPGSTYGEAAPLGADTLASSFNTTAPTGTWNLFVRDFDSGSDSGSIARGWALHITTDAPDPDPPVNPDPPVIAPPGDTAKPTVQISKVTTKKGKRKATVEFAGADDQTAASALTFTCQLDKEAPAACASPATFKGLKFGKHTIAVRSVDAAGNASDPVSDSFRIKRKPKHH
jgi:subtilisin-like proprotein convertase family protein